MAETTTGLIFKKIPAVMADVSSIGKGRKNTAQNYNFRGIDDVYNELHDILTKHKIFTVPTVIDTHHEERTSQRGNVLIYRIYTVKYTFYAEDGSSVDCVVVGEGMDSGDKAGNKALSVAHKYALLQVFAIPTEEPKDPEIDSPRVGVKKVAAKPELPKDLGDISDLASNPEEDMAEKEVIVAEIKAKLEEAAVGYKEFKQHLFEIQRELKHPRNLVGKNFGNLSLTEGNLNDLKYLKQWINSFIDNYTVKQAKGEEHEQQSSIK